MPITRTPIVDDDGSGTTGTVLNNAWKQELYNQIDGLGVDVIGHWNLVPYTAGDYTTNGAMTWTVTAGNIVAYRYCIVGDYALVVVDVANTTVGGTPNTQLIVKLPTALQNKIAAATITPCWVTQLTGGGTIGVCSLQQTNMTFFKTAALGPAWSLDSATRVTATLVIPLISTLLRDVPDLQPPPESEN